MKGNETLPETLLFSPPKIINGNCGTTTPIYVNMRDDNLLCVKLDTADPKYPSSDLYDAYSEEYNQPPSNKEEHKPSIVILWLGSASFERLLKTIF